MPNTSKKSFVLYNDLKLTLDKLTDDQAGKLIKAVFEWQVNGSLPELDFTIDIIITPIIEQLKRDSSRWKKTIARDRKSVV